MVVTGPLGQRDSSGTGTSGYRVHATLAGELELLAPDPTPTPLTQPDTLPVAEPDRDPRTDAGADPTAEPHAGPQSNAATESDSESHPGNPRSAAARLAPVGSRIVVRGTVTAEAGRLGTQPLFAIGDASGGIIVRLPDEATAPRRGSVIQVAGKLADPYGQLEVRPGDGDIEITGSGALPSPIQAPSGGLGESTEARLVTTSGVLAAKPTKSGNSIVLTLERSGQASVRVMADSTSGLTASILRGRRHLPGHGDRRPACEPQGRPRWLSPVVARRGGRSAPRGSARRRLNAGARGGTAAPKAITIGAALRKGEGTRGRRRRGDGAGDPARRHGAADRCPGPERGHRDPPSGWRVRAANRDPTACRGHGEARVRRAAPPGDEGHAPRQRRCSSSGGAAIGAREDHEWELVRIHGPVASVHKLGDRWRAEIRLGERQVVVVGQAGAGIAVDTLAEDRIATVTGIVRRPYPTASDQRFTILPRYPADVRVTGSAAAAATHDQPGPGPTATPVPPRRRRPPPRATRSHTDVTSTLPVSPLRGRTGPRRRSRHRPRTPRHPDRRRDGIRPGRPRG